MKSTKRPVRRAIVAVGLALSSVGVAVAAPEAASAAAKCNALHTYSRSKDQAWFVFKSGDRRACNRIYIRHTYDPVWSNIDYHTRWYRWATPSTPELIGAAITGR